MRFGIVVSRFNEEITEALLKSCLRTLRAAGVAEADVRVVRVPGAFEIPWAAARLARSRRLDAVICLGAVLKGQTPQNDYIAQAVYANVQRIAVETGVPCVIGVLTPRTWAQAVARTRGKLDRGAEAAHAALEVAGLKV